MDVATPIAKIYVIFLLLWFIFNVDLLEWEKEGPDDEAFFPRQKWPLKNASQALFATIFFISLWKVVELLSYPFAPLAASATCRWFSISAIIPGFCRSFIVIPCGAKWSDFGMDKAAFLGSGIVALNIALVYFALSAAGVRIPLLMSLATEAKPFSFWLDGLIIGVGWAFSQELLFRGMLYAPVARQVGKLTAACVLAAMNSMIHLNVGWSQTVVMFLVFLSFYFIYVWTKSLWATVFLHIGINAPLWQPSLMAAMGEFAPISLVRQLYVSIPLLTLLMVDMWWLLRVFSRKSLRPDSWNGPGPETPAQ